MKSGLWTKLNWLPSDCQTTGISISTINRSDPGPLLVEADVLARGREIERGRLMARSGKAHREQIGSAM